MKKTSKYRLTGSTLLEVLVALGISSVVFVVGTLVWININGSHSPVRALEQRMIARELIGEARLPGKEEFAVKGLKFLREVKPVNEQKELYEVMVTCFSAKNEELFRRAKILRIHED